MEAEDPHVHLARGSHPSTVEGHVGHVHVQSVLRIGAERARGGPHGQQGEVIRTSGERIVCAVERPLGRGEAERTDEALADALRLERGECRVLRCPLHAVVELEASGTDRVPALRPAQPALPQEDRGHVLAPVVGQVIDAAETQRPCRCGPDRIRGNPDKERGATFESPLPRSRLLRRAEPRDGMADPVASFGSGIEPVPGFGAYAKRGERDDGARGRRGRLRPQGQRREGQSAKRTVQEWAEEFSHTHSGVWDVRKDYAGAQGDPDSLLGRDPSECRAKRVEFRCRREYVRRDAHALDPRRQPRDRHCPCIVFVHQPTGKLARRDPLHRRSPRAEFSHAAPFFPNKRKPLKTTSRLAPMSANTAIHMVA